ncbi:MAG: hypothetical protein AAGH15_02260 [Myxococcota bacterium]
MTQTRLPTLPVRHLRITPLVALLALGLVAGCSMSTKSTRCAVVPLEDTGECDAFFTGFWFDGDGCVEASATGCDAPANLHATQELCEARHAACLAPLDCAVSSLSDPGPGNTCAAYFEGFAYVDGACVPRGLSGCDRPAGLFETEDACRQAYAECLPEPTGCEPVELVAIGGCEPAYIGFRWDGTDCVDALGTGCEWPAGLHETRAACLAEHRACPGVCDVPPEPAPEPCDAVFDGWRFTGTGCEAVTFSGCGLPASYFETEAACVAAYGHCGLAESDCVIGGCSSQLCADEALPSTCEWLEEYACYQAPSARCERQADGQCGWTPTSELEACLAEARSDDG